MIPFVVGLLICLVIVHLYHKDVVLYLTDLLCAANVSQFAFAVQDDLIVFQRIRGDRLNSFKQIF